jgi:hypothetical protein
LEVEDIVSQTILAFVGRDINPAKVYAIEVTTFFVKTRVELVKRELIIGAKKAGFCE